MANILCIGMDDASMHAKQAILERAGHTVSLANDVRQVIAACSGILFDVILIGQSIPAKEKVRVHELLQDRCNGAKILEQHATIPELSSADAHVPGNGSNDDLVAAVASLVTQRRSA